MLDLVRVAGLVTSVISVQRMFCWVQWAALLFFQLSSATFYGVVGVVLTLLWGSFHVMAISRVFTFSVFVSRVLIHI